MTQPTLKELRELLQTTIYTKEELEQAVREAEAKEEIVRRVITGEAVTANNTDMTTGKRKPYGTYTGI